MKISDWFRQLYSTLYTLVRRRKRAKADERLRGITREIENTFEPHPKLSRYEIQRRLKDAHRRRRHLKPSSKHFPPSPVLEKRQWNKDKKMEED